MHLLNRVCPFVTIVSTKKYKFHSSFIVKCPCRLLILMIYFCYQADNWIKEEAQYLRVAMGHENEDLDEFVEAHKTCLNDLMYFPTRNAFGLSSVAGNMEKLAALQSEFENVRKNVDDDIKKASNLEKKAKILTDGYEVC